MMLPVILQMSDLDRLLCLVQGTLVRVAHKAQQYLSYIWKAIIIHPFVESPFILLPFTSFCFL